MNIDRHGFTFDWDLVAIMLIGPFGFIILFCTTIIPSVIMMFVLVQFFKMSLKYSYWLSMAFYVILSYVVYRDDMKISCLVYTVIAGGIVTVIYWNTFKRLESEEVKRN
ncbi:MAG: hypothetical protein LBI73_11360 [Myroides sp.]|nr:hypothetical protein [Myroides sp.]